MKRKAKVMCVSNSFRDKATFSFKDNPAYLPKDNLLHTYISNLVCSADSDCLYLTQWYNSHSGYVSNMFIVIDIYSVPHILLSMILLQCLIYQQFSHFYGVMTKDHSAPPLSLAKCSFVFFLIWSRFITISN